MVRKAPLAGLTALWPVLLAGGEPLPGSRAEFRVGLAIVARCEVAPRAEAAVVQCNDRTTPSRVVSPDRPGEPPAADPPGARQSRVTIEF